MNLFALEISLQGAKEDFQKYATLHLKAQNSFLCEEILDDFKQVEKIICAFSKQPHAQFKTIQNDFFIIQGQVKDPTFFLVITPLQKMKLLSQIFNLHEEEKVFDAEAKLAKHWMVIGYQEKIPFLNTEPLPEVAINFPYFNDKDMLPYVGGLDMQGNPVQVNKVQDVKDYITIKNHYKEKRYEQCLELVDEMLYEYPHSLFTSEFLFYRIKSYFALEGYDNVIEDSKAFLREYSADENIAEVLSMIAKSYAKVGMTTDADYFFDRLFSEHTDSEYTNLGFLYKGEILESSGASSKALEFYLKALNQTKDLSIAALAAYKLAFYKVFYANVKEAAEYVEKILGAKNEFFYEHLDKSLELMYLFEEEQDYVSAAGIAGALLKEMPPSTDIYEELLSLRGVWLSKTEKKEEALQALNEYLNAYNYGFYEDQIQVAKDSLFFDTDESNLSAKLSEYDLLMEKYADDTIGTRAMYEKAKLLLSQKMYSDVLGFKDSLGLLDQTLYPDTQEIIKQAAMGVMTSALENKACQEVLDISNEHNISILDNWDDGLYQCFMKGAEYVQAKKIAEQNLRSQDLSERKRWLYRYIEIDFITGDYEQVLKAAPDLIALIEDEKDSEYKEIYRIVFDTYHRLEDAKNMLLSIKGVQKVFPQDWQDTPRYVAVMSMGAKEKDDTLVIEYAEVVVALQKRSGTYLQSPFVEFALYQAYVNKQRYNEALTIIKSLDERELGANERARQKYLLGSAYDKLWRNSDAKQAYQESIDADPSSAWAELATSAKSMN